MKLMAEPVLSSAGDGWESLLEPITGGDAAGESLCYEGTFDRIRHARQCDDETLAQGVWQTTPKRADWSQAAALCMEALETRSKDLQLAAWLLEAWLHQYGFGGVARGLSLIHGLCMRFGDQLHPRSADGDLEFRYAPIVWINDKLATDMKLVALTAPSNGELKPCTWADWEAAQRLVQAGARSREAEAAAAVARAEFHRSLLDTPAPWLGARREEIRDIIERTLAIEALLEGDADGDGPSLSGMRRVAEAIDSFLDGALARRESGSPVPDSISSALSTVSPVANSCGTNGIRTRDQAYRMLSEAAAYLRTTEPHSPVPYLVERAVAWGSMRLVDLLPELIRDRDNLSEVHRLLRIGPAN